MIQTQLINKTLLKAQNKKHHVLSQNVFLLKNNTGNSSLFLKQSNRSLITSVSKRDSSYYTDKDKVVSITYEEIGLFPRSFSRVLDRFLKQLFSDVDNLVIQEYRFYRYLFLTTIKTIFILFFVPFLVNFAAKNYVVKPITDYFWNKSHPEIFLNSYEQKRAFAELEKIEEKFYFETLVESYSQHSYSFKAKEKTSPPENFRPFKKIDVCQDVLTVSKKAFESQIQSKCSDNFGNNRTLCQIEFTPTKNAQPHGNTPLSRETLTLEPVSITSNFGPCDVVTPQQGALQARKNKDISKLYQEKTVELATYYNNHSIEAITNFFADLLSLCTLLYLLITLEIQINITKSFLLEVFFGLDDSKKSLLILLITDLLVGYHSSNLWELFFEFIFNHYGIPESQTGIFLLVATLPVLLDVLFKYLIFRHLNRSSPATVATYQAIIE